MQCLSVLYHLGGCGGNLAHTTEELLYMPKDRFVPRHSAVSGEEHLVHNVHSFPEEGTWWHVKMLEQVF